MIGNSSLDELQGRLESSKGMKPVYDELRFCTRSVKRRSRENLCRRIWIKVAEADRIGCIRHTAKVKNRKQGS